MNYKELENDCKVCFCVGVTMGEVRDSIASGCSTVEDVMSETNAGTRCKLCKFEEIDVNNKRPYYIDKVIESEKS